MSTSKPSSKDKANRMTQENIESFKGGYTQIILPPGTALFRFARARFPFSDCWMDSSTFIPLINGIQRAGYQRTESNKRNEIRNSLGIKEVWNPLTHRVKVVIKEPMLAYRGAIGPQATWISHGVRAYTSHSGNQEMEKRIEWRMGGHTQYIIPFLKDLSLAKNARKYVEVPVFQPIFKHIH